MKIIEESKEDIIGKKATNQTNLIQSQILLFGDPLKDDIIDPKFDKPIEIIDGKYIKNDKAFSSML